MGRFVVSFACLLCVTAPVDADPVQWICGLSEDGVQLVCIADADPASAAAHAAKATARVGATTFPLDAKREYRVDLWSPPSEPERVEQLAQAVICYRSPGCSVLMAGERWAALAGPVLTARAAPRSR